MDGGWARVLRHLQKRSIRYKLAILAGGIALVSLAQAYNSVSALGSFGVAILASVFAAFFLQVFPSDALDNRLKAAGLDDIFVLSRSRNEDAWFDDLAAVSNSVDIMGRSVYKWIDTASKRKRFSEIVRQKVQKGVSFRILLMSRDNRFFSALEEQKKPLHETLSPKISAVEEFLEELLGDLPESQRSKFRVRSNYALPFYRSVTRFDSTLFTVAYLDNRETGECPLYEIEGHRMPLFNLYCEMFDDAWRDARHREILSDGTRKGGQDSFENHLIRHQQAEHLEVMTGLMERATYCFHDFEEGWEYMFKNLNELDPPANVLRDLTMISVSRSGFKGYDFSNYPARVGTRSRDYGFTVRAIVVLDVHRDDQESLRRC